MANTEQNGTNCGCLLLVLATNLLLGGVCTQYVLNTIVPLWNPGFYVAFFPWCFLFGLFFGKLMIPLAILIWLLQMIGAF